MILLLFLSFHIYLNIFFTLKDNCSTLITQLPNTLQSRDVSEDKIKWLFMQFLKPNVFFFSISSEYSYLYFKVTHVNIFASLLKKITSDSSFQAVFIISYWKQSDLKLRNALQTEEYNPINTMGLLYFIGWRTKSTSSYFSRVIITSFYRLDY